jgi:hypothetical protein
MSSIFYISGVKQRLPFPRKLEHPLDEAVNWIARAIPAQIDGIWAFPVCDK